MQDFKLGINLIKYEKAIYTLEDIDDMANVIASIEANANKAIQYVTKKKNIFSSEEIQVWKCSVASCGLINNANDEFCVQCYHDKFGFNPKIFDKQAAVDSLKEKINILKTEIQ